jgi:hypothetical protein
VDGYEILRQLIDAKHPIILFGFQPSIWWCRISQPSTVKEILLMFMIMALNILQFVLPT